MALSTTFQERFRSIEFLRTACYEIVVNEISKNRDSRLFNGILFGLLNDFFRTKILPFQSSCSHKTKFEKNRSLVIVGGREIPCN